MLPTVPPKRYSFISDPGHGWVEVPITLLKELGIEKEITPYSYINNGNAYLEEDCDAGVFIKAYEKYTGSKPVFNEIAINNDWEGRNNYERYKS